MIRRRHRVRMLLIAAGLLAAAGAGFLVVRAQRAQVEPKAGGEARGPAAAARAPARVRTWGIGHVAKVDRAREEVRFDFGTDKGAKVGIYMDVVRPDSRPTFGDDGVELGQLQVTAAGDHESFAKAPGQAIDQMGIKVGDLVVADRAGRVLKFDPGTGEARIDLGADKGAEVGLELRVTRPHRADDPDLVEWLDSLEVTAVGEHESTAKVIDRGEPGRFPREQASEIRPGDEVSAAARVDRRSLRVVKLAAGDRADALRELGRARIAAARQRLDVTRSFYNAGELTVDRLTLASRRLMEAERDAAASRDEEVAAVRAHLGRMTLLVSHEVTKFRDGSGSVPNVAEARDAQIEAALMLTKLGRKGADGR